jgi:hypothetical protein
MPLDNAIKGLVSEINLAVISLSSCLDKIIVFICWLLVLHLLHKLLVQELFEHRRCITLRFKACAMVNLHIVGSTLIDIIF